MIEELDKLNKKFFKLFDEVQQARPSLGNTYPAFIENILEQYRLEYKLLSLKHAVGTEREIEKLQARRDRLVPQRWTTRIFHKKKQNYAATLIDAEEDLKAQQFFKACEAELAQNLSEEAAEEETPASMQETPGDVAEEEATEQEQAPASEEEFTPTSEEGEEPEEVSDEEEPEEEDDEAEELEEEVVEEFDDYGLDTDYEIEE